MQRLTAILLASLLLLAGATGVFGAEITVTTLADNYDLDGLVTLREAILAANKDISIDGSTAGSGEDTIRFDPSLAGGVISLLTYNHSSFGPSALDVFENVRIEGDAARGITIECAAGAAPMRHFYVAPGSELTLRNLTLRGGRAMGGNGGPGDQRSGGGGGAAGLGGAIYLRGTLTVEGCTFTGNLAQGGSGANTGSASKSGGGGGGGLSGPGADSPNQTGVGGEGGAPRGGAGGLAGVPAGAGEAGGVSGGGGGGGTGSRGGSGPGGAGGFGGGGGGGGAYDWLGISGGMGGAGGPGGFGGGGGGAGAGTPDGTPGVPGFGGGAGSLGNGTGNIAGKGGGGAGLGGGIFNDGGVLNVSSSTFYQNSAVGGSASSGAGRGYGYGGGIFCRNGDTYIRSCTFSSHVADAGGGLFSLGDAAGARMEISNSIVADSTGTVTDVEVTRINGGVSSPGAGVGNNLIERNRGFSGDIALTADPALGTFGDHGGPTHTLVPSAQSPALDAGIADGTVTDQRGVTRPIDLAGISNANDGTDIGAVEFGTDVSVTTDEPDPVRVHETLTWTFRLRNEGPDTATGVVFSTRLPDDVTFADLSVSGGAGSSSAGSVSWKAGDLAAGAELTMRLSVTIGTDARQIISVGTVRASTPDVDVTNHTTVAQTAVFTGDGSLYLAKGLAVVNWAKHAKDTDSDTILLAGVMNRNGLGEDLTGARFGVALNGYDLLEPVELDAKGKAKSVKGDSPNFKIAVSAKTGKFVVKFGALDLRKILGVANVTEEGTLETSVIVYLQKTRMVTPTWSGLLEFAYKTKEEKKTVAKFSWKKDTSITGAFLPTGVKVKEKNGLHSFAAKGPISGHGGGSLTPMPPPGETIGPWIAMTVTIGDAKPIDVPYEALGILESVDGRTLIYLKKGEVPALKRLTINNLTGQFLLLTNPLESMGLPANREEEPTTAQVPVTIAVYEEDGTRTFHSTVEVKRKKPTTGKWSG